MVSALGLAFAAMMAERSEICPVASLPFCRFTATVSSVVLTWNVESTTRCSSPSSKGLRGSRFTLAGFPCFVRAEHRMTPWQESDPDVSSDRNPRLAIRSNC